MAAIVAVRGTIFPAAGTAFPLEPASALRFIGTARP
jgi:hypothetical protein